MATKRQDIENLVTKTIDNQDSVPTEKSLERGGKFSPPRKQQVQIRFDPGDYETLQRIAYRKGTTAAALIRQAVKEMIRDDESV